MSFDSMHELPAGTDRDFITPVFRLPIRAPTPAPTPLLSESPLARHRFVIATQPRLNANNNEYHVRLILKGTLMSLPVRGLPDSSLFAERLDHEIEKRNVAPSLQVELPRSDCSVLAGLPRRNSTAGASVDPTQRPRALLPALHDAWAEQLNTRAHVHREMNQIRRALNAAPTSLQSGGGEIHIASSIYAHSSALHSAFSRITEFDTDDPSGAHSRVINGCAQLSEKLAIASEALTQHHVAEATEPETGHNHGEGGGAIVVDLDEAIHGVYAAVAYLVQALKGGGGGIAKEFADNARLLASNPLGWVKDAGTPHGMADFGIAVGVAGALLPLALMAIKAGLEEMHGAAHTRKELKAELAQIERDIQGIDGIVGSSRGATAAAADGALPPNVERLLSTIRSIREEREQTLGFLREQNKADGGVGFFSTSAGLSILTKASTDIATKSAFIATGGHPVALAATGAAGIAGTFALGPVAAASALGLGGYMVHKSRKKRDAFRLEKNATEQRISDLLGSGDQSSEISEYHQFLSQKLEQHDDFFASYASWNKGFLAGSTLYTGSVAAKVAVVGAVAAGGVALAHPPVLAALLALGTVGGVVMGASSQQFLTGHGRQHRYQGYFKNDDPELNRDFLASVDLLATSHTDADPLIGLKLRSAFFGQISSREDQRQTFLQRVADDAGKRYEDKYAYTADPAHVVERRGPKPTKGQFVCDVMKRAGADVRGRLRAASSFVEQSARLQRPASAKRAAKKTWNESRAYLTRTSLKSWLADPANTSAQIDTMTSMLDSQLEYLEAKLDAKTAAFRSIAARRGVSSDASQNQDRSETRITAEPNVLDVPGGIELKKILVSLDMDLEFDQLRYSQALAVRAALTSVAHQVRAGVPVDESGLAVATDRFVTMQKGEAYDPHAAIPDLAGSQSTLATYLMKDAPKRYRDLRGKLIETELQATRLRTQTAEASDLRDDPAIPVGHGSR
ncbi:hypothetical protein GWC77_27090 [Paraburkholderia sp. NMBU_R16]|uniref:hypothetical protein n=1 Tax=Paraburkholderia sp. NMBU_R16 TaxID=2698676 RepID=UPI0015631C58|nr:hypothetical protein [Paraburkholderia sp. NMBU_R16]NRO99537.1 hypothetical protein [Paraburkholderia sp. NMBU_R16]